ncbi:hypothetical protein L6164_028131 [Bauhinia variegata]|uniref:Uncharacterized protein n=1 Tax=Bauhinia variegata TaxID=167791 RepID=A0ACB9LWS4_BAUVA|nr:hypothetical protein L6164_028131 [Bauhinia variegata]
MLVCKNANSRTASTFKWRCVLGEGSRRLVRCLFLPVGKGLDIAYVSTTGGNLISPHRGYERWIEHIDQQSGEVHVIRK